MALTALISVLAVLQLMFFGILVGNARHRYNVVAPAVSGNETFERYFRVQMNTLELMVMFLPALWLAGLYVRPLWTTVLGVIYLIGRLLYWRGYVTAPAKRGAGFGLSMLPILVLLAIALVGSIIALIRG
ncbi:MAG: MAPEG family protein [Steroidobacteraceae bacterium]